MDYKHPFRTIGTATSRIAALGLIAGSVNAYQLDLNSSIYNLLDNTADNSWIQLNANNFSDSWAPQDQTLQAGSFAQQFKIIEAWSSFAWDSNRGELVFWGGGHANYTGNDVYTWGADSLEWERASLPSAIEKPAPNDFSISYNTVDGVDNAPISSHTYDSQFYFENADRFVTMGGAAFNDGDAFRRFTEDPNTGVVTAERTGPYFWDPSKADPNKVGGLTGSQVDPANNPSVIGGEMWENRNSAGQLGNPINFNTTSAVDNDATNDRALIQNNLGLFEYIAPDVNDSSLDEFNKIGDFGLNSGITEQGAGAYDPVRDIYLRTLDGDKNSGNAFTFWDLAGATGGTDCPVVDITCNNLISGADINVVGGTINFDDFYFYGMDFDQRRDAFILWAGEDEVWSLEAPTDLQTGTWTLTLISEPGTSPARATSNNPITGVPYAYTGILGSWKYIPELDVFLGSQDGRGEIWAFRPDEWAFSSANAQPPAPGGGGGNAIIPTPGSLLLLALGPLLLVWRRKVRSQ